MECCPKAVIGALASQIGAQLLCLGGIRNVWVQDWAPGHLENSKMSLLPPLLSTGHMPMNADLLAPGTSVFYLRGATGERVPTTVVGLSSFLECVTISYEHRGHKQYYHNCPVERLTFPIVRAVRSHCLAPSDRRFPEFQCACGQSGGGGGDTWGQSTKHSKVSISDLQHSCMMSLKQAPVAGRVQVFVE